MKKIKKISKITLDVSALNELKGGSICEYDHCNIASIDFNSGPPDGGGEPPKPPSSCKCGCSDCSWQDGGQGFTVGMNVSNLDGMPCNIFAFLYPPAQ